MRARDNQKIVEAIMGDLAKITGQKAVPCKAKNPLRTSSSVRA